NRRRETLVQAPHLHRRRNRANRVALCAEPDLQRHDPDGLCDASGQAHRLYGNCIRHRQPPADKGGPGRVGAVWPIDAVYVDNNDHVTKGQQLARLDPSRLRDALVQTQAALAAAEAQVVQNEAAHTKANADLARMEEVYRISSGKVPAKTELDNARAQAQQTAAQVRSSKAQVMQAGAQVSSARTNLSKATIYSP